MATTETITILKIDTGEAVKNVGDLKSNIKILKETLQTLEIGSREYQDTLDELKVNQNALKDAMYATSSSMEDVTKAASGANVVFDENNKLIKDETVSYNAYVHAMASLKEEFRSTADAVKRAKLADAISQVNDELKEMDAAQGNFQRNVGNYEGALKSWAGGIDAMDKGLKMANGSMRDLKGGVEAFAKSPAIASFALIVSVVMKLADSLKENETAMAALKKGMEALKPVTDFIAGIVEKLASFLADIIGKVSEFVTSNGLFQKIISGVTGVGNAIFQFITAPLQGVFAAIKVFKEKGIKGIKEAAQAFGQEMKQGVSFKQNFNAGAAAADAMISGMGSRKKEAKTAGKTIAKEVKEGVREELLDIDKLLAEIDKTIAGLDADFDRVQENINKKAEQSESYRLSRMKEQNKERLALLEQFYSDALDRGDLEKALEYDTEIADLRVEIAKKEAEEKAKIEEEYQKARVAAVQSSIDATTALLGTIADLYEADEAGAKRNAGKIKALRIASAIIDTISGAVGAFTQASKTYPPPYGQIIGAASAATVTAAGMANIAKMRSTATDGSGTGASVSASDVSAVTQAPSLTTQVSSFRTVTSASEEDRLNAMYGDQRVVLVMSDLELREGQRKVQVAEASF